MNYCNYKTEKTKKKKQIKNTKQQYLEYYITAAADIMGLTKKLAPGGEEVC